MDPVEIAAIATGIEQLITLGITVYNQIQASNAVAVKPLADIIADANAKFAAVEANSTK